MNTVNFRCILAATALIALAPAISFATEPEAKLPVGSWLYTVTIPVDEIPENNIVFQGVETYIPGGGYTETDQLSFSPSIGLSTPSHGTWASKSATVFLLTYFNFTYDKDGKAKGKARIRQTATLSADGKSYTGSGDFTYTDPTGELVLAGAFTITATRIEVEAPTLDAPAASAAVDLTPYLQQVKRSAACGRAGVNPHTCNRVRRKPDPGHLDISFRIWRWQPGGAANPGRSRLSSRLFEPRRLSLAASHPTPRFL